MIDYEILNNDQELNNLIDSINESQKDKLMACHGRYHTSFVISKTEKILKELGYDKRTIELGKIAALLHDIGVINGKEGHPKKSSEMCLKYLDKTNLSRNEKQTIIDAISDHSAGANITSHIGAVLLLVDKISLDKKRVLELGKQDESYLLLSIDDVDINLVDNKIIITFYVNEKFSTNQFETEWSKGISIIKKACLYLNHDCEFIFK